MDFDWHSDPITRVTMVSKNYKNTQNVRRFMLEQCGESFKFDRAFMVWVRGGVPKNMGEVADEWRQRHGLLD